MKRKIVVFLVLLIFVVFCFTLITSAERSVYTENISAINSGISELNEVMDEYADMDMSDDKRFAVRTNSVIVRYANMILELRGDSRVSIQDISGDVELLKLKGIVSGKCAWVFEYRSAGLSEKTLLRMRSDYERVLSEIARKEDAVSLSEESNLYITEVILLVYGEKIKALCDADDSKDVFDVAERAINEMLALSQHSAKWEDYELIYRSAQDEIEIQRQRDASILNFAIAYDTLYGEGSFDKNKASDTNISRFLYQISICDSVKEFNSEIASTLLSSFESLIEDTRGAYTRALADKVISQLTQKRVDADNSGEILNVTSLFTGLRRRIYIASLKDMLDVYAIESFGSPFSVAEEAIVAEYNREGGIFDLCQNEDEGEIFLKDAKRRISELVTAREYSKTKITSESDATKDIILGFSYLSDDSKTVFCSQIDDCVSSFSEMLSSISSAAEAEEKLKEYIDKLNEIYKSAELEELTSSRTFHLEELRREFLSYKSTDYAEERYDTMRRTYDNAIIDIERAESVDKIAHISQTAKEYISSVRSLFDDKVTELLRDVNELYAELVKNKDRYTQEDFNAISTICSNLIDKLSNADRSVGIERINELAQRGIMEMKSVRARWTSCGDINSKTSGFAEYPAGYDHISEGIWGMIEATDGLYYDIYPNISLTNSSKFYKKALKEAIKYSRISYVGEVPLSDREISDKLRSLEIKGVLGIKLTRAGALYDEFSGKYTVKILLPQSMRNLKSIKVVYISSNGYAEYYDAECNAGFLVFQTSHFSDFLVLGEKEVNLFPIIIFLLILAIIESIAVIAIIVFFNRQKTRVNSIAPYSVALMSVLIPSNSISLISVLSVIDILLAAIIFVGIHKIKKHRMAAADTAHNMILPKDFGEVMESPVAENIGSFETRKSPPSLPIYLESVSAEDADSLISDSSVPSLLIISDTDPKICRGCQKTFVNVDTLSDNFLAGECVSLKTLREKGLVSMSTCYVKVLARGVIDKPLTVKAQSFSSNAVKMITLTGGTAILEGNGAEMKNK